MKVDGGWEGLRYAARQELALCFFEDFKPIHRNVDTTIRKSGTRCVHDFSQCILVLG